VVARIVKGQADTKSRATALKYEAAIEKFIQSMGPRAQINLRQVLPRDLLRWRESEVAFGKHPGHLQRLPGDNSERF